VPLGPGDRVLTTDHAYPACRKALFHLAARRGFEVDVAEIPLPVDGPEEVVNRILERAGPRTRLALVCHVTSPTAVVFPIAAIVDALQQRAIDVLVDGAHSAGQVAVDLQSLGAAYFTGNAHKWLCAPKASAFLAVRADRHHLVEPPILSHFIDAPEDERFPRAFDWMGTFDPTALLAIPAAIDALESRFGSIAALMARNHETVVEGRRILLDALEVDPPVPPDLLGAMAAIPLPDAREPLAGGVFAPERRSKLEAGLEDARIQVPVTVWPRAPRRWMRISAQAYNRREQYERLASVTRALLRAGA